MDRLTQKLFLLETPTQEPHKYNPRQLKTPPPGILVHIQLIK